MCTLPYFVILYMIKFKNLLLKWLKWNRHHGLCGWGKHFFTRAGLLLETVYFCKIYLSTDLYIYFSIYHKITVDNRNISYSFLSWYFSWKIILPILFFFSQSLVIINLINITRLPEKCSILYDNLSYIAQVLVWL